MIDIEVVWSRIKRHEGESYYQIRGKEFTYSITGNYLNPPTNRKIPKINFKEALGLLPLSGTTKIQHLQGPSYIYAILMDKRIRQDDW